jgi:Rab GDP dissociation inhibitor
VKTDVTRYLEFKAVDGSFVFHEGKIHKVPSSAGEALKSSLMGMFEKRRCGKFLEFVGDYEEGDPKTWNGISTEYLILQTFFEGLNPTKQTTLEIFKHFGLSPETIDFIGHAMALRDNDE